MIYYALLWSNQFSTTPVPKKQAINNLDTCPNILTFNIFDYASIFSKCTNSCSTLSSLHPAPQMTHSTDFCASAHLILHAFFCHIHDVLPFDNAPAFAVVKFMTMLISSMGRMPFPLCCWPSLHMQHGKEHAQLLQVCVYVLPWLRALQKCPHLLPPAPEYDNVGAVPGTALCHQHCAQQQKKYGSWKVPALPPPNAPKPHHHPGISSFRLSPPMQIIIHWQELPFLTKLAG